MTYREEIIQDIQDLKETLKEKEVQVLELRAKIARLEIESKKAEWRTGSNVK